MTRANHPGDGGVALEAARVALARIGVTERRSFQDAMRAAATIATEVLGVGRVSVWLFFDEKRAIRCDYLHQPGGPHVFAGAILRTSDFPHYFKAMDVHRVVTVTDVADDEIVEEFREAYFRPLGISAMLDAPMYHGGEIVGIVCHEHLGAAREWTRDECEFATDMSDAITRLYAEAAAVKAEHVMSAYQHHLERLGGLSNLGRLAAGMSHDFGNILAAIVGSARLLIETHGDDPEVTEVVSGILEASDRASSLNGSLMVLGQNDTRRPRVINPAELVESCRTVLSMAVGPGVDLEISATEVSCVFVDPSELERVLLNLVVNARDAMPEGGRVTLTLREAMPRRTSGQCGHFVAIEVSDTGTGIDGDTLKQIFEPFFTTKGRSGTGLGMSIVQQIVVLAGGFVEVDSVPGNGTTIRVFLPAIGRSE